MRAWVLLLSVVGSSRWASWGPRAGRPRVLALGILKSSRWATWGPRAGRRPGVLARGVPGSSVLCSSAVVAGGQCQLWGKAKN